MTNGSEDYVITRSNTWEDSYGFDASYLAVTDIASLLTTLTTDPDGTIDPHVTSIDLACTLSPQHDRARVVDVTVPGGVHVGSNTVRVTMYAYGDTAPTIVDVPLTIPDGMSAKGTIYAKAPFTNVESEGDGWYGFWSSSGPDTDPPRTLADVVAALDRAPGNDQLLVAYDPPGGGAADDWGMGEPWGDDAVTAQVPMNTYLTGSVSKSQADISVYQESWPAVAGRPLTLKGNLNAEGADLEGSTVKIYTRDAGETTDTLLMEVPVESVTSGDSTENTFAAEIPAAKHTTTVTAAWDGNDSYLRSTTSTLVEVQAVVSLGARVTSAGVAHLTAKLRPADTGGRVAFMLVKGSGSSLLRKVTVGAGGTATCSWKPKAGAYRVRAVFLGSDRNTAANSRTIRVIVR